MVLLERQTQFLSSKDPSVLVMGSTILLYLKRYIYVSFSNKIMLFKNRKKKIFDNKKKRIGENMDSFKYYSTTILSPLLIYVYLTSQTLLSKARKFHCRWRAILTLLKTETNRHLHGSNTNHFFHRASNGISESRPLEVMQN